MSSFNSLLASIGKPPGSSPSPKPTTGISKPPQAPPSATKPQAVSNGVARPALNNAAAGVKRKSEEHPAGPQAKVVRTEVKLPASARPSAQSNGQVAPAKPTPPVNTLAAPYRGTLKTSVSTQPVKSLIKPTVNTAKPTLNTAKPPVSASPAAAKASTNGSAPTLAPRGFAAIMAQAKAAQASKALNSTIQHKPLEKLTKKDRMKLREEAKGKGGVKGGKMAMADRSRSGTPMDCKPGGAKKAPDTGYKGTMKKTTVAVPAPAYRGTMKKSEPGAASSQSNSKKAIGQSRYNNDYVDWDDLDDAEDEDDEEGYYSEESDDMEAGFNDVEGEEQLALKAARKEDQEALAEEERHKREKEERRKKLMALNKSAAAKKKY